MFANSHWGQGGATCLTECGHLGEDVVDGVCEGVDMWLYQLMDIMIVCFGYEFVHGLISVWWQLLVYFNLC